MSDNDHLTEPMLSAAMDEVIRLRAARDMDLRVYAEQLEQNTATMDIARIRIEALEADVDRFVGQRDKALEFIRANAHRIEALEAALREIAGRSWHPANVRLGDIARAALAPEPEK